MSERWHSVDEVAEHLGVVRETVYRWIDRKGLPAHRIGKFWKFKISEVDAWAQSGSEGASYVAEPTGGRESYSATTETADAIPDRDPLLGEIVERLVVTLHPDRIYLIGSRARGDADEHSDYDILVLVDGLTEPAYRLSQRGYGALRGIPAAVDVLVWVRATFDARLHLSASFPATVVREGRLLYAA